MPARFNSTTNMEEEGCMRFPEYSHHGTRLLIPKYRRVLLFVSALLCLLLAAIGASAQNQLSVTKASGFAVSPRVIDLPDDDKHNSTVERPYHPLPDRVDNKGHGDDDLVRQHDPEPRVKGFPHADFNGIGANGYAPPDTNIAVGPGY